MKPTKKFKKFDLYSWTIYGMGLLLLALAACQPTPPPPTATPIAAVATATPAPTATPTPQPLTCADLDAAWGHDWPSALAILEKLSVAEQRCGDEPLLSKKYAAHYIYGVALEDQKQTDQAIAQYRAALAIDPQRKEALDALVRLKALPKPTPSACLSTAAPRPDPAPADAPDTSQFVTVKGEGLQLAGQPFTVKGLNYYPRQAPWQRFLREADPAEMAKELDIIQKAGFNTLRIFLWYEPLFTCQPEDAIPNESAFTVLDQALALARERNLKVIMTLNDLPDLIFRPLYTDLAHYDNQTIYIVRRYRNDPTILAWDVRNEGDINYGAQSKEDAKFTQAQVIDWLAHITPLVKENDPHHLITAGWWGDPLPTDPYVDFLSFHHWDEPDRLQARLNEYHKATTKPLVLGEIGYDTWAESAGAQNEQIQADNLGRALRVVEAQKLAGWIVWTAFDFVPAPGQPPNPEHFFGLWRTDLTPKPVLKALPLP